MKGGQYVKFLYIEEVVKEKTETVDEKTRLRNSEAPLKQESDNSEKVST